MHSRIYFFKSGVRFRFLNKVAIAIWIKSVIANSNKTLGTINFIFCSDDFLLGINKQYLKHNYFTDIISFDYSEGRIINGEIYISIDRVKENAELEGEKFQVELSRVIIHGVLHLLGHSDRTILQKKQMRKKEDACLSLLSSST